VVQYGSLDRYESELNIVKSEYTSLSTELSKFEAELTKINEDIQNIEDGKPIIVTEEVEENVGFFTKCASYWKQLLTGAVLGTCGGYYFTGCPPPDNIQLAENLRTKKIGFGETGDACSILGSAKDEGIVVGCASGKDLIMKQEKQTVQEARVVKPPVVKPPVDCEWHWDNKEEECGKFVIDKPAQNEGSCPHEAGFVKTCPVRDPIIPDVDCFGEWSNPDEGCGTYQITRPKQGNGQQCNYTHGQKRNCKADNDNNESNGKWQFDYWWGGEDTGDMSKAKLKTVWYNSDGKRESEEVPDDLVNNPRPTGRHWSDSDKRWYWDN